MPVLATRKLIDASGSLPAVERALLNLWINRGLDDQSLAAMTGMSPAAIADRRARIVEGLSAELGLPPGDVDAALSDIAASSAEGLADMGAPRANVEPVTNGQATAGGELVANGRVTAGDELVANGHVATNGAVASEGEDTVAEQLTETAAMWPLEPAPAPLRVPPEPPHPPAGEEEQTQRRPVFWALVAVLAAVALLLVLLRPTGGKPSKSSSVTTKATPAAQLSTTPPIEATSPSPSPTVSRPPVVALGALPGGLAHTGGSVNLVGSMKHLNLRLSVRGLPAAVNGHYEVWLYDTVLDSQPLARLRNGVHQLSVPLPAAAHRYRFIDISFQPIGVVNHSGESVLRADNPAVQSRARLRRSAARRRALHEATGAPVRTHASAARHRRAQR